MITRSLVCALSLLGGACLAFATACGSDEEEPSSSQGEGGASGTAGRGGGTGGTNGGGAVTVADICPELVAAGCDLLAEVIEDEVSCVLMLNFVGASCGPEIEAMLECAGPDPDISCDPDGMPVIQGCEAAFVSVLACAAGGEGGAGGAGAGGGPAGGAGGAEGGAGGSPAGGAGGAAGGA